MFPSWITQPAKLAAQAMVVGIPRDEIFLARGQFAVWIFGRLPSCRSVDSPGRCCGARCRAEAVIVRVPGHQVLLPGCELAHWILWRLGAGARRNRRRARRRSETMIIGVPRDEVLLA